MRPETIPWGEDRDSGAAYDEGVLGDERLRLRKSLAAQDVGRGDVWDGWIRERAAG